VTEILKLLDKLQTPGLILAGLTIWLLFKALAQAHKSLDNLSVEISESGKTTAKMAALLDLVCNRLISGGK
jgi:hypothetical protein